MLRARIVLLMAVSPACTVSTEPPPHVTERQRAAEPAPPPDSPRPGVQPPPPKAAIAVQSPGTAGRDLRPAAPAGSEHRLITEVTGKMEFSGNGAKIGEVALPRMTATWLAKVKDVRPDGSRAIELSIEDAAYDEAHAEARAAKATARAVETLEGLHATFVLDASGAPGPMQTRLAPRSLGDLRPSVEAMLMVVPLLFVPAPDAPLGTDASWTASSTLAFSEMSLAQAAQYRVTAQDQARTQLSATLKDTMPSPSAVTPGARQITDLRAEVQGSIALSPGGLLPVSLDARVHAVQASEVTSGGDLMPVEMVLDVEIHGAPAA